MNQSPKSLRNLIKIGNSDLGEIGVVEVDGNHYVTESSIVNFMNENEIDSQEQLIESLIDFNHIDNLSVLDENTTDETLELARDVMMLYEDLNPFSISSAARGRSLLRVCMTQMSDIICKGGYAQISDIDRHINKCDRMLEDIQEEKAKVKEKGHSVEGQAKFSCMFLFNLSKTVFLSFVVPLAALKKITLPAAITKLFARNGGKAASGFLSKKVIGDISMKTMAAAASMGFDAVISVPPDIKGLYLSIAEYEKLLNDYEREIRRTKSSLVRQKDALEKEARR